MGITHATLPAKVAAVVAGLCLIATSFAPAVHAQSNASLEAQIQALLAQVAALQAQLSGGAGVTTTFSRDLTLGASGADVTQLQNWLISKGYTIPAGATGYFGAQTRTALASFQAAQGIVPAAGYFGPVTRAKVNGMIVVTPGNPGTPGTPSNGGDLKGGAGSIDSYELISSLNNEEVGEDEEDAEVAGLEIEVDDGSDIRLTAVRLSFDEGTATEDFEDYASEVSLWLDGEEVARIDADEFTDRNDWTKTISLDRDAVIRRGDTGELTVAISGARNIDSADIGDTWTVDFSQIRFVDADGATITDSPNTAPRTFSFESFATAADAELHISKGDDDINDSRVITVDNSKDTKNEDIFSFNVKADGRSDLTIDEVVVDFDFTGTATQLDDVFSKLCLEVDGDQVGCETVPSSDSITFEDLDLEVGADDTVEFVVVGDIHDLRNGTYAEGDTITARITSAERNAWDVEDESGEALSTSDRTGTATTEAISLFESGITVKAVSTNAKSNEAGTVGTFTVVVNVTAFGDDQYIYRGADTASSTESGFLYTVYRNGEATTTDMTVNDVLTSSARLVGGDYYHIREGRTERFTLTVTVDPDAGGLYTVELDGVRFDPDQIADDSAEDDTTYRIPSTEDVETPVESLIAS